MLEKNLHNFLMANGFMYTYGELYDHTYKHANLSIKFDDDKIDVLINILIKRPGKLSDSVKKSEITIDFLKEILIQARILEKETESIKEGQQLQSSGEISATDLKKQIQKLLDNVDEIKLWQLDPKFYNKRMAAGFNTCYWVKELLETCQKEKTLENKLIDAGFEKDLDTLDSYKKEIFRTVYIEVTLNDHEIIIEDNNLVFKVLYRSNEITHDAVFAMIDTIAKLLKDSK